MGASQSKLSSEEVNELTQSSHFSAREIQKLFDRFTSLDRNQDGLLSAAELQLIPELSMNPLCSRIVALFDEDNADQVTFSRFVQTLSALHPRASQAEKLQVAFKCYDVDQDGLITEADLFHVLKLLVGSNLDDGALQKVVQRTLAEAKAPTPVPSATKTPPLALDFAAFAKVLGDASSLSIAL